jgi:arsenate reductase (glutaredoxin)
MIKIYGIKNCDTVKKALLFLQEKGSEYLFIDFKKIPPTEEELSAWRQSYGDFPINKKGTTYKKWADKIKELQELNNKKELITLIQQETSLIKRPVVQWPNGTITFGFDTDIFTHHLQ